MDADFFFFLFCVNANEKARTAKRTRGPIANYFLIRPLSPQKRRTSRYSGGLMAADADAGNTRGVCSLITRGKRRARTTPSGRNHARARESRILWSRPMFTPAGTGVIN